MRDIITRNQETMRQERLLRKAISFRHQPALIFVNVSSTHISLSVQISQTVNTKNSWIFRWFACIHVDILDQATAY